MKLVIQIPCFNESATLAIALAALPRMLEGIDTVEWLIVDDGSRDGTVEVARRLGVHHIVRHTANRGLAQAFMTGIDACLKVHADVIVNTDADNQYQADDIPALIAPILAGEADIVIGARPIGDTTHFSWMKKKLEQLGSWAVRMASQTEVMDAPSGFRAITREAAMRLNVFNAYTYTLETIIQAGQSNMRVANVPIRTNPDLRPSRLVRSIPAYVGRSVLTILRVFVIYKPLKFFAFFGTVFLLVGLAAGARYLWFFFEGNGAGHVQSVILCALAVIVGLLFFLMGIIGDLIATNRKLLERIHLRVQRLEHRQE
ncbi:glycosyltransferase family 2 protein [Frateuria sp. MAH-13]|uniref:Glycosyltransferase family 2 protein n=1 Tax=Frateuria flava TaxID=2821489 RepID=A0ABS4DQY1_9GAMM|nr:glycosyltransferase family 2 protein [Frateuria flava]MBP1475469.1 glycosyltransferase family 2 protein [Frateuria flava]